jgi:hypothetical protein
MFGVLVYILHSGMESAQLAVEVHCDILKMTNEQWRACFREAHEPEVGVGWFEYKLRYSWPLIPAGPALMLVTACIGWAVFKVSVWVWRGFLRG